MKSTILKLFKGKDLSLIITSNSFASLASTSAYFARETIVKFMQRTSSLMRFLMLNVIYY